MFESVQTVYERPSNFCMHRTANYCNICMCNVCSRVSYCWSLRSFLFLQVLLQEEGCFRLSDQLAGVRIESPYTQFLSWSDFLYFIQNWSSRYLYPRRVFPLMFQTTCFIYNIFFIFSFRVKWWVNFLKWSFTMQWDLCCSDFYYPSSITLEIILTFSWMWFHC